jgi:TonB family protein
MKPIALLGTLAALMVLELPCSAATNFAGSYRDAGNTAILNIQSIGEDYYSIASSRGWEGVGILSGTRYRGVFREPEGDLGRLVILLRDDTLEVHISYEHSAGREFVERWHRIYEDPFDAPLAPQPAVLNDYPYVEELPQAISKVQPILPEAARRARIEGTVMIQAHVLEDGTVGETRILKSIQALDGAAIAAVRQWRFKPATSEGKPVSVWVAVPVNFSLH